MLGKPWFLFAHGAGASSASEWMQGWRARLSRVGPVETFDYPYMRAGRRLPDALPRLIEAHAEALAEGCARHGGPAILVGKSLGGRVGCHVSAGEEAREQVRALICFGYPLRSQGKTPRLRDQVLLELEKPVLFIQGTRDPLCPLETLHEVLPRMRAPTTLHVVEDGDHSLLASKTSLKRRGMSQDAVDASILAALERFSAGLGAAP